MFDFTTPKTATQALRLAKTAEKALAMYLGTEYRFEAFDNDDLQFFVLKGRVPTYLVSLRTRRCTCADFAKHKDYCKHLLCAREVHKDNWQVKAFEDMISACENTETGCDYPY